MAVGDEGQVQGADDATEDVPDLLAALEEEQAGAPVAPQDADASDDEGDEDDSADDESDEEAPEPFDPKTASAAEWTRIVLVQPQRRSEVPGKLRNRVDELVSEDTNRMRAIAQEVQRQTIDAQRQIAVLEELWNAGDREAFDVEAAKNPNAELLFHRMHAMRAEPPPVRATPEQDRLIARAASKFAELDSDPEAQSRAASEIAQRNLQATPDDLVTLTEIVERAKAGAPAVRATTRITEAAASRRSRPKVTVPDGGRAAGGQMSNEDFLKIPLEDPRRADLLFR